MSPRFWEVFGHDPEEKQHLAAEWQHMIHPDDLQTAISNFEQHCADPSYPYDQVVRYQHKNGSTVWVRCRGMAIRDEKGKPIRMLGAHIDVTETQSLLERYRTVMDSSSDGLHTLDMDGRLVEFSDSFIKMLGYDAEEAAQLRVTDWDVAIAPQQIMESIQCSNESPMTFETRHQRKDGSVFDVEISARAFYIDGEKYIFAASRDISERKQTESRMYDLVQELERAQLLSERANQAKADFLASMSHELRTPLTSILGNCEYLLESGPLDHGELIKIARSIESAGRNQLALVNDILDMSKIESGKFTISHEPYDLSLLLKNLHSMLVVRAQDANLAFTIHQLNDEPYKLIGDAQRITQILINLAGNALKFTECGSVTLTTKRQQDQLVFQVKDTGIGMSSEVQKRLFKRFEQADGTICRRFGGSGLGLFISFNLAELMGGTIRAHSIEGEGSTFELYLPYQKSDVAVGDLDDYSRADTQFEQSFSGHVLIVEDTPALQALERRILEKMGLTVQIAGNGKEAIGCASAAHFDAILMDMQMPVMDGIEATRKLRASGNRTPIIALTANVMQKHRDQFHQAGCNGFIEKPIDKQVLYRILSRYLKQANRAGQSSVE